MKAGRHGLCLPALVIRCARRFPSVVERLIVRFNFQAGFEIAAQNRIGTGRRIVVDPIIQL